MVKKKTKKFNISNSILNIYRDYLKLKACGTYIEAVYINKTTKSESSDQQQAGQYFEYRATGAKLYDGSIPDPILTATGHKNVEKAQTAEEKGKAIVNGYAAITKHVLGQIVNFNNIYKTLKIEDKGLVLEYEEGGKKYKGILDVVASDKTENIHIRDIKTTGMLDNIWEEGGWGMLLGDNYKPKKKHLNQAILYICLWYKMTGNLVPFYFDVFSNTNPNDCKTIKIVMDEHEIDFHWKEIASLSDNLIEDVKKGLKPRPDMKRCRKCPVKNCKSRTNIPEEEVLYV